MEPLVDDFLSASVKVFSLLFLTIVSMIQNPVALGLKINYDLGVAPSLTKPTFPSPRTMGLQLDWIDSEIPFHERRQSQIYPCPAPEIRLAYTQERKYII